MQKYHIAHIISNTNKIRRIHNKIHNHPFLYSEIVHQTERTLSNKAILEVKGMKDNKWIDGLEVSAILMACNLPEGCRIVNMYSYTRQKIYSNSINHLRFSDEKRKKVLYQLKVVKSDSRSTISARRVNDYSFLMREGNSMIA